MGAKPAKDGQSWLNPAGVAEPESTGIGAAATVPEGGHCVSPGAMALRHHARMPATPPDFRLYHSNALEVLAGLLAEELRTPAPGAVFDNFGASSLDFFMWFFVADVSRAGNVQSDLRIAIMKAFKEEGIEIPYNQYDVHLRDLDGVRALINRVIEERVAKTGAAAPDRSNAEDVDAGGQEPPPRES